MKNSIRELYEALAENDFYNQTGKTQENEEKALCKLDVIFDAKLECGAERDSVDDNITDLMEACHKNGFESGFKMATSLFMDGIRTNAGDDE